MQALVSDGLDGSLHSPILSIQDTQMAAGAPQTCYNAPKSRTHTSCSDASYAYYVMDTSRSDQFVPPISCFPGGKERECLGWH